jgi:Uma2 family endonuclease
LTRHSDTIISIESDVRVPALLAQPSHTKAETVADLLERLGGIQPARVRLCPTPGTATEADVATIEANENRLFELADGVLVEKIRGYRESFIACLIVTALNNFVVPRRLGAITGADGMMRLFPGLVRIPDVAFITRDRLPGGKVPAEPVPSLVPDLAIEVLSVGNTPAEMDRKRREYFDAGVRLLWLVDPDARTVKVYSPDRSDPLVRTESHSLDGAEVLPGFSLGLHALFADVA